MNQTYEAVIGDKGVVRLLEDVRLPGARRALVTVLADEPIPNETALLSEAVLEGANHSEEDAAWAHQHRETSIG